MDPRLSSSADWNDTELAIQEIGERLRARAVPAGELPALGEAFVSLATHPKWEVRQAVARALAFFRHDSFARALAPLLVDRNPDVKNDAERTQARRSERIRSEYLSDDYAAMIDKAYEELGALHDEKAREAARRVAARHVAIHMRVAHHQLVKPVDNVKNTLVALDVRIGKKLLGWELGKQVLKEVMHVRREIRTAQNQADYLRKVLERLRDLNTPRELSFQSESLREIVMDAYHNVAPKRARKKPLAELTVAIDSALRVDASRASLVEAFSIFLQNSLDALAGLDRAASIRVEARAIASDVVVRVHDNGAGILPDDLGGVFKPLMTTKKKRGNAGLGLTIARSILEAHGGSVVIESVHGESTTVTVTLPLEQEKR